MLSLLNNYADSWENKLLSLQTVHGSHEAVSQKMDYPLLNIIQKYNSFHRKEKTIL